ncbi:MAG: hypothetical protein NTZ79_02945 [Proteobacteria bacterium]|nr:hypothetical protein [Pseudomonadota bacterium]
MATKIAFRPHCLALAVILTSLWAPAWAQSADTATISVPSLNMPTDQQMELAKAIYQQIVAQGASINTLVLVDEAGVQVSFNSATLSSP